LVILKEKSSFPFKKIFLSLFIISNKQKIIKLIKTKETNHKKTKDKKNESE